MIYLLEVTQTICSNKNHNWGRICGSNWSNKGNCVAHENSWIFAGETSAFNSSFDWQHFCNKVGQEPNIPWSNEAHQYKIPSNSTSCWGQNNPHMTLFQKWEDCRNLHQSTWKGKVWKSQNDALTRHNSFKLRGGMLTPNYWDWVNM